MKIVNGFKPFIIFTKKLHLDKVPNTHLQKQPLKKVFRKIGVLKFVVKILQKYLSRTSFLVKLQADSLQHSVTFPEVFP